MAMVSDKPKRIVVALAGNPNAGKTTIFNNLTGARHHVGNYPGVTVEKKEGACVYGGIAMEVVDLPGTYSLTAHSIDEVVARNFIIDEKPDVVVDILDSSNLERNLYLAVQLLELGAPLVLDLNMSDIARSRGYIVDRRKLSSFFRSKAAATVGRRGKGMDELKKAIVATARSSPAEGGFQMNYGREIEEEIGKIEAIIGSEKALSAKYRPRWLAIKLLEDDEDVRKKIRENARAPDRILTAAEKSSTHLQKMFGDFPEIVMAERRYGFISGACQEVVQSTVEARHTLSDKVDSVLTNRIFGVPIFLGLMWLVFQLTFKLGAAPMGWIELSVSWLAGAMTRLLPAGYVRSLITDGIIGGVGGVLVFLPNIMLLFMAIAILEDSGYMARAVFILDAVMHRIGLHGKSFIPLLLGFGCNVPAIMATRTLETARDRLLTMLIIPLMSCAARLPVYTLLAGAFFSERVAGNVVFSVYLVGILMAIIMAKVLGRYVLPGDSTPFVMELPPYRVPTVRGILVHMWERAWLYVRKAGTVILCLSVIMWFLCTFPAHPDLARNFDRRISEAQDESIAQTLRVQLSQQKLRNSFAGRLGRGVAVFLHPVGLGDWKIGTAVLSGFAAKEVVVSTLATLYSVADSGEQQEALRAALKADTFLNPLVAYTLMIFVVLYVPCIAAVAVVKQETNSWRWPVFMICYTTALAWTASFLVYNTGRILLFLWH